MTLAEPDGMDTESELEDEGDGILSGELTFRGFPEIRAPLKNEAEERLELRTDCRVRPDSIEIDPTEWEEEYKIPLSQLQARLREKYVRN